MEIKTAEQIAGTAVNEWLNEYTWPFSERREFSATELADAVEGLIVRVIEADRAQRQPEPVHPDWQDDADMYRDAASVEITWRGWTASGAQVGYSDAGITGAQAAAMFEAIGRLEY
mgnify:CR=1 FL=1